MATLRRLAAIMFTDLDGYSALAHTDEAGALNLLEEQERLIDPLLATHRGRKIKSMGDGLLIEFPNAKDAVECAVEIQRSVHARTPRVRCPHDWKVPWSTGPLTADAGAGSRLGRVGGRSPRGRTVEGVRSLRGDPVDSDPHDPHVRRRA